MAIRSFSSALNNYVPILVGLSTDAKPSGSKGQLFIEEDTGAIYSFDGSTWRNVSSIINVSSVSSDVTLTSNDGVILATGGASGITINLPSASSVKGKIYNIKKVDSGTGAITIDAYDSETIDGNLTLALSSQNASVTIVSDGSNWFVID